MDVKRVECSVLHTCNTSTYVKALTNIAKILLYIISSNLKKRRENVRKKRGNQRVFGSAIARDAETPPVASLAMVRWRCQIRIDR